MRRYRARQVPSGEYRVEVTSIWPWTSWSYGYTWGSTHIREYSTFDDADRAARSMAERDKKEAERKRENITGRWYP